MGQARAVAVLAVVAMVLAVASGCTKDAPAPGAATLSEHGQDPSDVGTGSLPDPVYVPITGATTTTAAPGPLAAKVDNAQVEAAARAGSTRIDGERFALMAAQVISDTRDNRRGRDVIDEIASPTMAPEMRTYLVQDAAGQRELETGRHLDTSLEMWFRSALVSGTDADTMHLSAEVVANQVADAFHFNTWYLQQIEVVSVDGVWSVVRYAARSAYPEKGQKMTAAERKRLLVGTGWRRIAPAGG